MSENIHFALGPVQGFVAQARRTRDLWSGSFLLSYLAGCAMNAVAKCPGGEIIVPDVRDDLLFNCIKNEGRSKAPNIGSLPNWFEARANDPKKAAVAAENAINDSWKKIAKAVWNEFLTDFEDCSTKAIWDRQVPNFWEINWTIGPEYALNHRKNWRTHHPPIEGGDHCTMMGDLQELSGYVRSKESKQQDAFWKGIQSRPGVGKLNIRDGERLCAIALIKRLFPNVSMKAIQWEVLAENWPSTLYIAAVPWLEQVAVKDPDGANAYGQAVIEAAQGAKRKGISEKIESLSNLGPHKFLNIDGNFYFDKTLEDCQRTPLKDESESLEECKKNPVRQQLESQLRDLYVKCKITPVPFYTILLMDGDKIGDLIQKNGSDGVSKALANFTKKVEDTVRIHNGITIYAGGDDVLAMLPLPRALNCALDLSEKFEDSFRKTSPATISAGLVFSHYQVPLRSVLSEARRMLKDVAKYNNGRGSLAVSVLKNSGKYCQWAATWESLKMGEGKTKYDDLLVQNAEGERQFSNSFFFNMRDIFSVFLKEPFWKPGSYADLVEGLDPLLLLTAEYMSSREQDIPLDMAKLRVRKLLDLSYRNYRKDNMVPEVDSKKLCSDAAMLLKFLTQSMRGDEQ
jgi:CRISPR-associated protein Cmr2